MKIQQSISKIFKVIDAFNGNPLEKAEICLKEKNSSFLHKNGGFYIVTNLKEGFYHAVVKCAQYKTKEFSFQIADNDKEIILISLRSSNIDICTELFGKMIMKRKKAADISFYYTIDCEEYKKRISSDIKKGDSNIHLYTYDDTSLEGRKFAMEETQGIYILGNYDYRNKRYKLLQNIKDTIEIGMSAYLLFEGRTDENGYFQIFLPNYLIKEGTTEFLFFTEKKSCRFILQSKKELIKVVF